MFINYKCLQMKFFEGCCALPLAVLDRRNLDGVRGLKFVRVVQSGRLGFWVVEVLVEELGFRVRVWGLLLAVLNRRNLDYSVGLKVSGFGWFGFRLRSWG